MLQIISLRPLLTKFLHLPNIFHPIMKHLRESKFNLYARPKVETSRDYQISITTESIELIISSIDSAYPNYIIKICLFLL